MREGRASGRGYPNTTAIGNDRVVQKLGRVPGVLPPTKNYKSGRPESQLIALKLRLNGNAADAAISYVLAQAQDQAMQR